MNTILTGLRANGDLHLGNYLGAILPMVQMQKSLTAEDRLYMFIPDLHSFTTPVDHGKLYENSIENVRVFLAAGIDSRNEQSILYRQSQVPAHSELQWILSCFTYYGEASRMTEFKDKADKLTNKSVSVGLFNYPILMAADILLYGADYVPVGEDQQQHMELTRTIAQRMNEKFGDLFTVPKPWKEQLEFSKREYSVRIKSLAHPENKMSKSVDDPRGTITLADSPEEASKKIMAAQTDNEASVSLDFEKQPGVSNLLQILTILKGRGVNEVAEAWAGKSEYGELKSEVAETVSSFLQDLSGKLANITTSDAEAVLKRGEAQANMIATKKLEEVKRAVGLSS